MDPNAVAQVMRDTEAPLEERQEAAKSLAQWLANGGFPQRLYGTDGRPRSFGGNTAARFAATEEVMRYEEELS